MACGHHVCAHTGHGPQRPPGARALTGVHGKCAAPGWNLPAYGAGVIADDPGVTVFGVLGLVHGARIRGSGAAVPAYRAGFIGDGGPVLVYRLRVIGHHARFTVFGGFVLVFSAGITADGVLVLADRVPVLVDRARAIG